MVTKTRKLRNLMAMGIAFWMFAGPVLIDVSGQRQRTTTRSTTTRSTTGTAQRSTATRSTTTRTTTSGSYNRGAVAVGDEGYAAVGPRGAVVANEEGAAAVGRRGAVVATEEGVAAKGRYGNVVVADRYESYEAWRVVAGTARVIAIGTMLAHPPTAATTVVVTGTTYWVYQNTYYARAYSNGAVVYQVVAKPM